MFINIFITILLLTVFVLSWFLYKQSKSNPMSSKSGIKDIELEFDSTYHALIEKISTFDNADDAYKFLLQHIDDLTKESIKLNASVQLHKIEYTKNVKKLEEKTHEITHISHQMRTSLSGLLGFTKFLSDSELNEEQQEFCSIIEMSSNELLILVNSIIDMTPKPRETSTNDFEQISEVRSDTFTSSARNEIPSLLVVDDNEINKKLLAKVLEKENLDVSYASDGQEAVELRKNNDYDIIFMDIQMPVMNGVDASKAIRQFENDNSIPPVYIVALTANTGVDDRDSYLDAGMDDYMAKPIIIDEIRKRIDQL